MNVANYVFIIVDVGDTVAVVFDVVVSVDVVVAGFQVTHFIVFVCDIWSII